jgi:hypothetical protein
VCEKSCLLVAFGFAGHATSGSAVFRFGFGMFGDAFQQSNPSEYLGK